MLFEVHVIEPNVKSPLAECDSAMCKDGRRVYKILSNRTRLLAPVLRGASHTLEKCVDVLGICTRQLERTPSVVSTSHARERQLKRDH